MILILRVLSLVGRAPGLGVETMFAYHWLALQSQSIAPVPEKM